MVGGNMPVSVPLGLIQLSWAPVFTSRGELLVFQSSVGSVEPPPLVRHLAHSWHTYSSCL